MKKIIKVNDAIRCCVSMFFHIINIKTTLPNKFVVRGTTKPWFLFRTLMSIIKAKQYF